MARSEAPAWRKPPANGYPLSPTATAPVADSTPLLLEGHHLVIHPKGRPGPWYQMASIEIGAGEVAHIAPPLWWREQKREVKGFRLSGGLFRPPLLGEEQEQETDIGYWSSLHRTIAGLESALGYAGWRPRAGRAHFPMAAACCRKRRRGTARGYSVVCAACLVGGIHTHASRRRNTLSGIPSGGVQAIPAARGQPQGRRLPSKRTPGSGSRRHRGTGRRQARVKVGAGRNHRAGQRRLRGRRKSGPKPQELDSNPGRPSVGRPSNPRR